MILSEKKKAVLLIILSAFAFGSYGVWSRLMGDSFGVFFQGGSRGIIILIIALPILYFRKEIVPIPKSDWKWFSIFLIFTSATQAPLYYAFNHMDIGLAQLIFFVTMLLTMYVFGMLFLKEKLTKITAASFVIAVIGLVTIFPVAAGAVALLAAFMAIINGVASGGEVASSKKLSGTYSALYITWLGWIAVIVTNMAISIYLGERMTMPAFDMAWFYQLCYSLVSLIGFWSIIAGLKHIEASIGGLIGLLEIIFAMILGLIIFDEVLTPQIMLGTFLILFAAILPHAYDLKVKAK